MIRKATIKDIDHIMSIVSDAQLSLRELGIDQWQDGYPSVDVISPQRWDMSTARVIWLLVMPLLFLLARRHISR